MQRVNQDFHYVIEGKLSEQSDVSWDRYSERGPKLKYECEAYLDGFSSFTW